MYRFALTSAVLLLTTTAFAAPPQVLVKSLSGQSTTGRLTALAADSVTVGSIRRRQESRRRRYPLDRVPSLGSVEKPSVWLDLLDGSQLSAHAFSASSGTAHVELASGLTIEFPTRSIRTVRFRQQTTPTLTTQWREITASVAAGDMVVVRKSVTRAAEPDGNPPANNTEYSLDQLEGTLLDVGPDSVQFEFDGEKINVRREKLEGLVYFQPAKREFAPPLCRLIDSGGSTWLIREYRLETNHLAVTTLGGVTFQTPLAAISKLDYSAGNIVFLAALEPDSGAGEPLISLQPAAMTNKFGRLFHYRVAPPLGADAFRIAGTRYDSGLSLRLPLTLVYRVPEGFRWFRAVAGVDDSVVAPGNFTLLIKGDGRELLRHDFPSDSAAGRVPLPLDLDIAKIRRLTIQLDPQDGQDIGDQLNLCEARFTK